jgi:hypothetical protein
VPIVQQHILADLFSLTYSATLYQLHTLHSVELLGHYGDNKMVESSSDSIWWPGIAQSVQRVATDWTVLGSNPGGGEIYRTRADRPWGLPNLLYNGYRVSILGVKRPGRDVNHPPSSSAEVKERVELYLSFGLSWPVLRRTLPFYLICPYFTSLLHALLRTDRNHKMSPSVGPRLEPRICWLQRRNAKCYTAMFEICK